MTMHRTATDFETLAYIAACVEEDGIPPTYEEMSRFFGIRANAAYGRVRRLVDHGMVETQPGLSRTISITKEGDEEICRRQ